MPTKRPRVNVTLHRYTHRILRQYADHHCVSLSELISMAALLVAHLVHLEALENPTAEGSVAAYPPDVLLDLYRAHPDYDPERAEQELMEPLTAFRETVARVEARRPRPAAPAPSPAVDSLSGLGRTMTEISAEADRLLARSKRLLKSATGASQKARKTRVPPGEKQRGGA